MTKSVIFICIFLHFFVLLHEKGLGVVRKWHEQPRNNKTYKIMGATIYLPNICSIAMHKGELAYCLNISPYKLKKLIKDNEKALTRLGYSKYDKMLYPVAVNYLLQRSGLRIDEEKLMEILGKTIVKIV